MKPANQIVKAGILLVAYVSVAVVPVAEVPIAVVLVADVPLAVVPVADVPAAGKRDFFVAKIPPCFYKTAKLAERISSEYPDIFIAHYVSMVINFKCIFIV
jgi:hypothetical protein